MKQFLITQNDADQRLDKFLKKLFPQASRDLIYKLNRKEKIKVLLQNGQKTKQDNEYKLQVGETVQVYLKDEEIRELSQEITLVKNIPIFEAQDKLSRKDIVFEDGSLLLVNKAFGLNVHPGDHKTSEISLIQQVHDYLGDTLNSLTFKPSLVHRIDRDTSGLVMIAKQKDALTKMSAAFQKKEALEKIYFALVLGKLSRKEGTIKKNLLRIENAKNENKVQVCESGQDAVTHYKVLEEFVVKNGEETLTITAVEVQIETGRMHQIRVHMAHLGNPIVGDKAYGDKKINTFIAKNFGIQRHMLHAWKLSFYHPKTNKKMNLVARFKEDMEAFVVELRK